jgi:hypothetical protein
MTAWEMLLPEYRSEFVGWSKAGEFHCPYCSTCIGKNLKGDKPFYFANEHLATHPEHENRFYDRRPS